MAPAPKSRRPRLYFSFRSPYSWLAFHDLTTAYPGVAKTVEWLPFWEPDEWSERLLTEAGGRFLYTPMSHEKHLYMLGDVRRLATRRGLGITWPVDKDPCWEVSHLAYLVAAEHGRGMPFIERVYRARWREGRDVTDSATIAEMAAEVGVPAGKAGKAARDERMRGRGVEALLTIYRDSVFGVPFFINRTQRFWGVDRLPDFLASLAERPYGGDPDEASPAAPAPALTATAGVSATAVAVGATAMGATAVAASDPRSSDHGHAGGCG